MDNYKIIKKLGYGMIGTVHLVEQNNKQYALKIEHVLKKNIKKNMKSNIWREIDFCQKLGNKYPNQFITLIDYDFIDNCKHTQKYRYNLDMFPENKQKELIKLNESDYCVRKIYTLVDTTLDKIVDKLTVNQTYSMIIQVIYILHILHRHGYIHGDLHLQNIGVIKTNETYIKIFNHNVPTFGYIYTAIDLGDVVNYKDLKNSERSKYNQIYYNEIPAIKYYIYYNDILNYIEKNNIKANFNKVYDTLKRFDKSNIIIQTTKNIDSQVYLFDVLYPEKYKQLLLGYNIQKQFYRKLSVEYVDILFFVKNENNDIKLINYFIDRVT